MRRRRSSESESSDHPTLPALVRPRLLVESSPPTESQQFTCDGHDRDGWPFAVPDQMPIASMQPLRGAPSMAHNNRRLSSDPVAQRARDAGLVAIMPGGFDERAPRMRVAGFRDTRARPRAPPCGPSSEHGPARAGDSLGSYAHVDDTYPRGNDDTRCERSSLTRAVAWWIVPP